MKFINKGTIIAALVGGITALTLTMGGVALAYGGAHGKGGHWSPEKMQKHLTEMTQRLDLTPSRRRISEPPWSKQLHSVRRSRRCRGARRSSSP